MRSMKWPGKQPATAPIANPVMNEIGTENRPSMAVFDKEPNTSSVTAR